tara:strand:+ start:1257 stop:1634 length:378 start_codon:yes stop_codon:yes gene_type:complete
MNYENVYSRISQKITDIRFAKNGIKHHLSNNVDYPKLSHYESIIKKALLTFQKYHERVFIKFKNHADFHGDHREIIQRVKNIGKSIKNIVKINLKKTSIPANAHRNLYRYSKSLNTVGNTLLSIK